MVLVIRHLELSRMIVKFITLKHAMSNMNAMHNHGVWCADEVPEWVFIAGPKPPDPAQTVRWSRIFKCFQEPVIQNGTDTNSTSCACMTGYQHDQTSGDCIDIDECELGTHKCVDNICFNLGTFSNSNIDYTICIGWISGIFGFSQWIDLEAA